MFDVECAFQSTFLYLCQECISGFLAIVRLRCTQKYQTIIYCHMEKIAAKTQSTNTYTYMFTTTILAAAYSLNMQINKNKTRQTIPKVMLINNYRHI